ncbi:MAG: tRNA uracil 4-sulfurtransferase ThiI [Eubacteriales bacterium]|nr:tRNA uracil 4-sulfurtransferase ThiI [Eubacteriales bacterium]
MDVQMFLLKYGEIGIKGKNRYLFEDRLVRRVAEALRPAGSFKVWKADGRIYAKGLSAFDREDAVRRLQTVFGIVGICPAVTSQATDLATLLDDAEIYWRNAIGDGTPTFKCEARRSRKNFHKNSMEINCAVGERILETFPGTRVDVHQPEVLLRIEVRGQVFLYHEEVRGAGGMPVGSAAPGMLLLSGGIDSPVAGYMMAKRGMPIRATYFHAPPYTSDRARQKVVDLAKIVARYAGEMTLNIVNFTAPQLHIYERCPHDELTIIMRRYMMRIAEHFAKEQGASALITGESVGQVASQTVEGLLTTNAVCNLPVFRPLIGFDKWEIVELAQKIGSFETSILPYEDCCTIFVAKHPVTRPKLERMCASERKLAPEMEELVAEAIRTVETITVRADGKEPLSLSK